MPSWQQSAKWLGALIVVFGLIGKPNVARAQSIVGQWATSSSFGDVVSPTGAYVRSAYSGEAYRFRKDGTYFYVIVGSGTLISGTAVVQGTYKVEGQRLILTEKTEDWTPNPNMAHQRPAYRNKPMGDKVLEYAFSFVGPDTLKLRDLRMTLYTTLHRAQKAQ